MRIESREIWLAVAIAAMGLVFSSREFILWMSGLNPLQGLIVYYLILYTVLFVLSRMGLVVLGERIETPLQVLGLVLITFAFFIVVDWESQYIQIVVDPSVAGQVAANYFQSEDGAVFYIWQTLLPGLDPYYHALLTYVATPFILALVGGLLTSEEVEL